MRASCESSGHQARQGFDIFDGRDRFGRERFSGVSASARRYSVAGPGTSHVPAKGRLRALHTATKIATNHYTLH
jgi:hypothetical protein